MEVKRMGRRRSEAIFLSIQLAFWLLFLYLDLFRDGNGSVPIKYSSVAMCLLFSLYWSRRGGDRLITAALAFTLGADTFLLLLDQQYGLGVLLFCVVQGLYLVRIRSADGGHALWSLRLGLFLCGVVLLRRLDLMTPLNLLSAFYFTSFLCNALQSLSLNGRRYRLFSAGLLLFLCCDLCVGVFNLPNLFPDGLYAFASVGMWLFYLPSQVLIALSGLPDPNL